MAERKNNNLREEGFTLYANGHSITDVAKIVGRTRETVSRWKREEKWEERLQKIEEKASQKLNDDITEIRVRQRQICKAVQSAFIKKLKKSPDEINYSDNDKAMKHELLLAGEATERKEGVLSFEEIHAIYEECKKNWKSGKS